MNKCPNCKVELIEDENHVLCKKCPNYASGKCDYWCGFHYPTERNVS